MQRIKSKAEKERSQLAMEVSDLQGELEDVTSAKSRVEANARATEEQLNDFKVRAEEANMTILELNSAKSRLSAESAAATKACEDAESKLAQLNRSKMNMSSMLEELKGQVEEESKVNIAVIHRHDVVIHCSCCYDIAMTLNSATKSPSKETVNHLTMESTRLITFDKPHVAF